MLVWDPCSPIKVPLPCVEIPVHIADFNGKLVLKMLDEFMAAANEVVKVLIFDGHGAHYVVRRLMFGVPTAEDTALVQAAGCKFFSRIKYKEVPENPLPRLPLKLAVVDGETYHCFPAACFLVCEFVSLKKPPKQKTIINKDTRCR